MFVLMLDFVDKTFFPDNLWYNKMNSQKIVLISIKNRKQKQKVKTKKQRQKLIMNHKRRTGWHDYTGTGPRNCDNRVWGDSCGWQLYQTCGLRHHQHAGRPCPMEQRLVMIYEQIGQIIEQWKPEQVAIEELFFNRNITTGITVGQARGVLLLACAQKGLQVHEYTPLEVKQALVGNGRAEKKQVQFMVKTFLGLRETPKPDDAADALAIATCHTHYYQTKMRSLKRD